MPEMTSQGVDRVPVMLVTVGRDSHPQLEFRCGDGPLKSYDRRYEFRLVQTKLSADPRNIRLGVTRHTRIASYLNNCFNLTDVI
jgi:hypothetical protein